MAKANPEQLEVLNRGVTAWNHWREANPTVWPDLMEADFPKAKLDGVNLENANLLGANFEGASLSKASLRNANLKEANLQRACLAEANLKEANLYKAKLQEAEMVRTNLEQVNLIKAAIERTRFSFATFGQTSFDHNLVVGGIGLDLIFHAATSIIDVAVFEQANRAARGNRELKESIATFFQNAGVTERIVKAALESLSQIHEWSSCFISYSHVDQEFVDRLTGRLKGLEIPCHQYQQDFSVGSSLIIERAAREIIKSNRTLLCCSWASLASHWVEQEAEIALEKEQKEGRSVLIPLDIDGCLLENPYRPQVSPLAQKLKERLIEDFRGWRNPGSFETALDRLIDTLRAGGGLTR